jgi:hypothetical protein
MTAALQSRGELPPTTAAGIAEVKALEAFNETMPPADVPTDHFIHAGCYVRTCRIAAGVLLTSALIKVPTVVIISGDVVIRADSESHRVSGYTVLRGMAGRKVAYHALQDTTITMIYATQKAAPEDCEPEFTGEYEHLLTRRK